MDIMRDFEKNKSSVLQIFISIHYLFFVVFTASEEERESSN